MVWQTQNFRVFSAVEFYCCWLTLYCRTLNKPQLLLKSSALTLHWSHCTTHIPTLRHLSAVMALVNSFIPRQRAYTVGMKKHWLLDTCHTTDLYIRRPLIRRVFGVHKCCCIWLEIYSEITIKSNMRISICTRNVGNWNNNKCANCCTIDFYGSHNLPASAVCMCVAHVEADWFESCLYAREYLRMFSFTSFDLLFAVISAQYLLLTWQLHYGLTALYSEFKSVSMLVRVRICTVMRHAWMPNWLPGESSKEKQCGSSTFRCVYMQGTTLALKPMKWWAYTTRTHKQLCWCWCNP